MAKDPKDDDPLEEITMYLRCLAAYYDHCSVKQGVEMDATRAIALKKVLDDISRGRLALTISRLSQFLPESVAVK